MQSTLKRMKKEKQKKSIRVLVVQLELLVLLEAVPAVNRPSFGRLEGHFALCATVGAGCLVHFARSAVASATAASPAEAAASSAATSSSAVSAFVFETHFFTYFLLAGIQFPAAFVITLRTYMPIP
jgi:hypothetical protein